MREAAHSRSPFELTKDAINTLRTRVAQADWIFMQLHKYGSGEEPVPQGWSATREDIAAYVNDFAEKEVLMRCRQLLAHYDANHEAKNVNSFTIVLDEWLKGVETKFGVKIDFGISHSATVLEFNRKDGGADA